MQTGRNYDYKIKRLCEEKGSFDGAIQANSNLFGLLRHFVNKAPRKDTKRKKFCFPFTVSCSLRSLHPAFTLAEVLITLGIIGVVAALTIPAMMNNIQDAQYKTAYKKAYSVLSQALSQAKGDNALNSASGPYDLVHLANFTTIMSYIKLQKNCLNYNGSGIVVGGNTECWYPDMEGWHRLSNNGYPQKNVDISAIDVSGMSWGLCARGYFALYAVDTNGMKGPNQMGKDRFLFSLTDEKGSVNSGLPIKISPYPDNEPSICEGLNKCATENNYYGKSWLYE